MAVLLVLTVGAAAIVRKGEPLTRAAVATVVGLPAVATGAGIALPHLSKTGMSVVAVAGSVALVAGAALVSYGSVGLIRSTCGWWRVGTGAVLLAVTMIGLFTGGQAVAATNVPRTGLRVETPADRGFRYEDATFRTPDDVELAGWYLPAANRTGVILLHGAGSTRSDVLDHAAVLARHGYGVLMVDARGHGRSDGRAMDFGWYGDEDVAGAVSYLQGRPDVDPGRIAVIGLSMGGEEAIGAAATSPAIRAVVAEGATQRVAGDSAFLEDAYGVRGRIQRQVNGLTTALTDLLTDAQPPVTLRAAAAATALRPILLITAGEVPDETYAARFIQRGNLSVQVWKVEGAGHTQALRTHPDEWNRRVTAFIDGALGRAAG
ncbi:alpha/beta hydrolase [Paractinoplanes hotanensis]|uniref:Alpha/beta fold hydrolase n=1 Tax=Paractinoplanes hotanensis TaxID=2906497 RepID=A0ABT0Y6V6_9ACTN|nr:alpha/beta fold hydrolase [Actinoplanes hotanensis]MCM4081212.1 alpha/beta fold hydrolase [Actinoplanes hotanensis]